MTAPSILIIGGYGVVGTQICQMLSNRHPHVKMVIAGRSVHQARLAASRYPRAEGLRIDVTEQDPLAGMAHMPDAILLVVNDHRDNVLRSAINRGVAIIDIARWSTRVADAERIAKGMQIYAPIILASGWMAGAVSATINAVTPSAHVWRQIDIDILFRTSDKAGPDSIAGFLEVHRPFQIWHGGARKTVASLSDPRQQVFPSGASAKVYRFSTPDQESLVGSEIATGVAVRLGYDSAGTTRAFVLMVRSGLWGRLPAAWRKKLLYNPGDGAEHEIVVNLFDEDGPKRIEIGDAGGQTHMTAAGAVLQVERVLGIGGRLVPEPGVGYPEEAIDGPADLKSLRELGVTIAP